jgi:hypothetical protein
MTKSSQSYIHLIIYFLSNNSHGSPNSVTDHQSCPHIRGALCILDHDHLNKEVGTITYHTFGKLFSSLGLLGLQTRADKFSYGIESQTGVYLFLLLPGCLGFSSVLSLNVRLLRRALRPLPSSTLA